MSEATKYRPEIDGLRAVAVLPVVLFHAGFAGFGGGFLGVDVFFVISGYLITRLFDDEIRRGEFSIAQFYERRARRILPALYFVIVTTMAFAFLWMFKHEFQDYARSVVAVALFGSNIYFNQEINYFSDDISSWPLIHTWSLAVEEQFYTLFPFLFLLLRRAGPAWSLAGVAGLSVSTLLWAQHMSRIDPQADFYLPQFRAWELGAGALVALGVGEKLNWGRRSRCRLAGGGAVLLLLSFVFAPRDLAPSLWSVIPVGGGALLIAFASNDNIWGRVLSAKPLVAVGLVSYSAYLWHQPLFAFARIRFDVAPASFGMALLSVASFALAYLSWRFIERPFRDRRRFSRLAIFAMAAVGSVVLIIAGRIIVIERGFPSRTPTYVNSAYMSSADYTGAYRDACLDIANLSSADLAKTSKCRLGRPDVSPDFILIGDSHAAALADGLDLAAKSVGRSGIIIGSNACLPILGIESYYPRSRAGCRWQHDNLLRIVRELGIKLVVMHARWEALDENLELDGDGPVRTATKEEIAARFSRTLSLLAAEGAKVVIFASTPHADVNVLDILRRKARHDETVDDSVPYQRFLSENRTAFDLFSHAAAGGEAKVIDLDPFFCDKRPGGRCKLVEGTQPLFFDKDHLSTFGSNALAAMLQQAFE